jgi:hypothetical protein
MGAAGPVYKFVTLEELSGAPDDVDVRVFGLYPLPSDAIDRLVAAVAPHLTPNWPVWAPVWEFPSDDTRREVEARVDAAVQSAGPLAWVVVAEDVLSRVRALPVRTAKAS